MLRNVGDNLTVDMAQHPGRLESAPSNIKRKILLSFQRTGINVFLHTLQFIHDIQDTMHTPYRQAILRPYDHDQGGNVRFNVTFRRVRLTTVAVEKQ
jgi:hypothetical protein